MFVFVGFCGYLQDWFMVVKWLFEVVGFRYERVVLELLFFFWFQWICVVIFVCGLDNWVVQVFVVCFRLQLRQLIWIFCFLVIVSSCCQICLCLVGGCWLVLMYDSEWNSRLVMFRLIWCFVLVLMVMICVFQLVVFNVLSIGCLQIRLSMMLKLLLVVFFRVVILLVFFRVIIVLVMLCDFRLVSVLVECVVFIILLVFMLCVSCRVI